jgi:DNA polymerase-3 subunit beta
MKFVCAKESLVEAITTVQKSIATRTPLPILEGILIEAGEEVKLTGYDLEPASSARWSPTSFRREAS